METYVTERPAAIPAALAPASVTRVILAADAARLPQGHQVLAQLESCQALPSRGGNGTSGFTGKGIQIVGKRMDVRGVPPRERPV